MRAINETKLGRNVSDQDMKVEGYDVICCGRTVHGRFDGGICCYFRLDKSNNVCKDLDNQLQEILTINIRKPNSKPFVVNLRYRPLNSSPDLIDTLLGRLDCEHVDHYFIGDMFRATASASRNSHKIYSTKFLMWS